MFCQNPIDLSCDTSTVSGCGNDLYILAERIFDSCRIKRTLKDVRLHPKNLRPCNGCSTNAAPCSPLQFLGGSSACSNIVIEDLTIGDPTDSCAGRHHHHHHGGGCGCNCGCECDDGLRRIRGKACIPLNLYFADNACNRFVGDGCVCINIDVLMRMPTDAQIPPVVHALGSAMFCGGCECDDEFLATLEAALFLFVTGSVAVRIQGQTVTDIPACKNAATGNCNIVDNCLDTLPLFPDVRLGGYVLNPRQSVSSALLFPPANSSCPQAD